MSASVWNRRVLGAKAQHAVPLPSQPTSRLAGSPLEARPLPLLPRRLGRPRLQLVRLAQLVQHSMSNALAPAEPTSAPKATGLSFGTPAAASSNTTPAASTTPAPGSAPSAAQQQQPQAPAKPEPVPSMLENKTHGEIVNEMNRLLEARVEAFEQAANEVRDWDKVLINNAQQVRRTGTCERLELTEMLSGPPIAPLDHPGAGKPGQGPGWPRRHRAASAIARAAARRV